MFLYSATVYGTLPGGGWVSPTITTADAGVFTPMASVVVATRTPGLLRCRVAPGHGVDEVVWAGVGASGGAGGVGLTVAAVVALRRVAERAEHGGALAGLGLVRGFTERDLAVVVDAALD